MFRLAFRVTAIILCFAANSASAEDKKPEIPANLHAWGRFEPGTWRLARIVTETLNDEGQVVSTSTTDTKTTLLSVSDDGVVLEVEACMEVAGKRFRVEPQTIKEGFHGETAESTVQSKESTDGKVSIEGRDVPCKIRQLSLVGPKNKTDLTLYYSTSLSPYLLKRKCVVTDAEGKNVVSETEKDVIAIDMPVQVLERLRNGSYVRTVHKNGKTTVTTIAMAVDDVPGGVVSHSSKEVDQKGRLLRRSTLQLIDYNADPDKDRSNRKRPPRRQKTQTRYGS